MPDKDAVIPRARMSHQERKARARLAQLMAGHGWMRGTLLVRRRRCGKATCHCAKGEGHESLYVVVTEKGRTRQRFVPKDWEPLVRQWVAAHRQARQLMEEVSRIYWEKLRRRQR